MEMRSASVSSIVEPQSVPSQISVVLVEEVGVRGAECLASAPVDKTLGWLAGAACPASVTVYEDDVVMPGVVETLSHLTLTRLALLANMGHCPRLTMTSLSARMGRCPHLTLTALWALMGRCPHPTVSEFCFRPLLLGYRSQ